MNKIIMAILFISLFPLISSEVNDFASVESDVCVTIKQTCASCSYVNVSVSYPNSSLAVTNHGMSNQGGGLWTYEFCNTSSLGRYDITGSGDLEGIDTSFSVLYFMVTTTGADGVTQGQSIIIIISFLIMLCVGGFFFYLFANANSPAFKIIFGGLTGLIILMSIFYSVVLMEQNLGNFTSLVTSYSAILMVARIIILVAMLCLVIYALYRSFIMWQIKRGFRDE